MYTAPNILPHGLLPAEPANPFSNTAEPAQARPGSRWFRLWTALRSRPERSTAEPCREDARPASTWLRPRSAERSC